MKIKRNSLEWFELMLETTNRRIDILNEKYNEQLQNLNNTKHIWETAIKNKRG